MPANEYNLEGIKKQLFDRVHRTGEQINLDFPNILHAAIEAKIWEHYRDDNGKPFPNVERWLHYCWPTGVSLGSTRWAFTYEQVMKHCEDHPEVYAVLAKCAPKNGRGRPKKEEAEKHTRVCFSRQQPLRKPVLSARLAQDYPDFYEAFTRGQYKSIRAAAEAAGIVKPGHDPLPRLKQYWKKATAEQRQAFLEWIDSQ